MDSDAMRQTARGTKLRHSIAWVATCLAVAATAGCERAFVPPTAPDIEVLEPEPGVVIVDPHTPIALRATSFRPVDRVTLNGARMTFDPAADVWRDTVELVPGLNRLVLEAFDAYEVSREDTVIAVYYPVQIRQPPELFWNSPSGGHSATELADGRVLIAGGSEQVSGPARADAFVFDPANGTFRRLRSGLRAARSGHTAARLSDDRVLVLGGSRLDPDRAGAQGIDSLVSVVEIFDPATETFDALPLVNGSPIRRTGGTSLLFVLEEGSDRTTAVYLMGGYGDIRYGSDPRWGIRDDLRGFVFRDDTLFADGPPTGSPIEAMTGLTQTALDTDPDTGLGRYLFAGAYVPGWATSPDDISNVMFTLRFSLTENLRRRDVASFRFPRARHSASGAPDGMVVFAGGLGVGPAPVLASLELHVDKTHQTLSFPDFVRLGEPRWGHSATFGSETRILLIGGFNATGQATTVVEVIDLPKPLSSPAGIGSNARLR